MPLHFESLTINDGLSQGLVSSIIQDKKGFMWFATGDGLNKYDGYNFSVYHHDPANSESLISDDIMNVYEDLQGRLWISTAANGLDFFDREQLKFYHITQKNGLSSDHIYGVTEDKKGRLWVRTSKGLDYMTITPSLNKKEHTHDFLHDAILTIQHLNTDTLFESDATSQSPKFFVSSLNEQYVSHGSRFYKIDFYKKTKKQFFKKVFDRPYFLNTEVGNIIEDTVTKELYINTWEGVFKAKSNFSKAPKLIYKYTSKFHVCWYKDHTGNIWIPEEGFIVKINMEDESIQTITTDDDKLKNAFNSPYSIFIDQNNIVWLGSSGYGILKYNPVREQFHHVMPGQNIYRVQKDKMGQVHYINKYDNFFIDKSGTVSFKKLNTQQMPRLLPDMAPASNFSCIDSNNNYWFTLSWILVKYNLSRGVEKVFSFPFINSENPMFYPFIDKQNFLWFITGNTFVKFNTRNYKYVTYKVPVQPAYVDFMQLTYEDINGDLWLATKQGMFCFNTEKETWKHWSHNDLNTSSLSNDFVLSFCDDPVNPLQYIWAGTKGGLNKINKLNGVIEHVNRENGLPNNVIYGILPDNKNNIWLSTNNGLCKYNVITKSIYNYNVSDGLQSNEFNRYSFIKNDEGSMFFGGLNGITWFNPKEIKPLPPPNVIFTGFRLFNKTANFKQPNSPLDKDINFVDHIQLDHSQNMFTIQFAALDYRKTGSITYRYKLTGFDKDWIYTDQAHEATYTNLDPGSYNFIVQGSNSPGVWGTSSAGMLISVSPPWWRTWWFYLISALATLLAINAIYKYRIKQLLKLERVRNRIARDLHDEIGSSLSTISIYSKVVEKQLSNNEGATHPLLAKINENAIEVQEAMNDIVWSINTRNDDFESIVNRMREHAVELLETKDYKIHFTMEETLRRLKLKMEQRRDFYLIYKEALNNTAKYADGENVWVSLTIRNSLLLLSLRDDGKGFSSVLPNKNRNGLSNMKSRAKALNGNLQITSELNKGTTVLLSMPLKKQ